MQSAILVLHLMITVVLIGLVLLQRSEGGALGIGGGGAGGGGGGFGGMMSARGAASGLVRITVFVAAAFFITSITLSIIGNSTGGSVLDSVTIGESDESLPGGGVLPLGAEREVPPAATPEPTVPLSQ